MKNNTRVKITNLRKNHPEPEKFKDRKGKVVGRNGRFYTVEFTDGKLPKCEDFYLSEFERQ